MKATSIKDFSIFSPPQKSTKHGWAINRIPSRILNFQPFRQITIFDTNSHILTISLIISFLTNFRHLGSLTAANWVFFDFNISYSSCWGYYLINTLKLKKKKFIPPQKINQICKGRAMNHILPQIPTFWAFWQKTIFDTNLKIMIILNPFVLN